MNWKIRWLNLSVCLLALVCVSPAQLVFSESRLTDSDSTSNISHASEDNSDLDVPREISVDSSSELSYGRLAIVGGTLVGGMLAIHIYQQNGWWKNNRAAFHFREDLKYGLWVDKIGHFFGASLFTYIASKSFEWANVPEPTALWMGAGASFIFQTYIEMQDGFSAWGFDRVDFAANTLGALWPIARYYIPSLENVDVKFSYWPSQNIHTPGSFPGQKHLMMDDYEGQTFWLGLKVNNILPSSLEPYWPDFLGLAVGYAARDVQGQNPHPVVFISLDYDMTKIIPNNTWFLRSLGRALNFIRWPAPAVRISPSTIWYGVYF